MSIFPKKYHGSEVKCGGPGFCPDCSHKRDNHIPFDLDNPFANADFIVKDKNTTWEQLANFFKSRISLGRNETIRNPNDINKSKM